MWQTGLAWLSVALAASGADAQITVSPNVHISQAYAAAPHIEVVIAADPRDETRLLAAAIFLKRGVAAYRSSDGGKTWSLAVVFQKPEFDPKADPNIQSICDPTIAWGADGVYYAVVYLLKTNLIRPGSSSPLDMLHSGDGGKTWAAPVRVSADGLDRPFLAVDQGRGKFCGRVYCDFSVMLGGKIPKLVIVTSSDGGRTFSPFRYVVPKNCSSVTGDQSAVLADGTLIVPYLVFRSPPKDNKFQVLEMRVVRSTTGGESFLPEQSLTTMGGNADSEGRYKITAIMAADPGSPRFNDRVYLVWQQYIDKHYRVILVCSKDKGVTWSKPIVVSEQSDDKPYDAVLPAVAVNRKGVVGITWYDSRESRPGAPGSNVRFRASMNGGDTWQPSVRVTDVPSASALDKPNWKMGKDGKDFTYPGETAGLTADAAGDFHPAWVDKRTGVLQVFTAKISVTKRER
jgi:BNR/Asp-box repeat